MLARRQLDRLQRRLVAEAVVVEAQPAGFDVHHHAAGRVADRPQHALVAVAMCEAHADAKRPVGDQRQHVRAVRRLRARIERARQIGGRGGMRQ